MFCRERKKNIRFILKFVFILHIEIITHFNRNFMKKYVFFLFLFLFSLKGFSQDTAHSFSTGYGFSSTVTNTKKPKELLAKSLAGRDYHTEQYFTGISFLSYHYELEVPYISLGITYAFEMRTGDVFENGGTAEGSIAKIGIGNFTKTFHTVAAEVKYDYYRKKSFTMYALGGLGATFQKENYRPADSKAAEVGNSVFFNLQLTPIGMKYGNTFSVFGEIGFGYKGLLNLGVSLSF
jgi:hypothetical protein